MIVIWHPTVPRINRNIVECKLNIQLFAEGDAGGINRNIVECKYDLTLSNQGIKFLY